MSPGAQRASLPGAGHWATHRATTTEESGTDHLYMRLSMWYKPNKEPINLKKMEYHAENSNFLWNLVIITIAYYCYHHHFITIMHYMLYLL